MTYDFTLLSGDKSVFTLSEAMKGKEKAIIVFYRADW